MSTAVANKDPHHLAATSLKDYLKKCEASLQNSMPKGFGVSEKIIQSVLVACRTNTELYKCTPVSIASCMFQATILRLVIGGPLGQAYLVPYKDVCQFQVGYKGYIQLAHNSGMIRAFYAHTRYDNDEWMMELGTQPRLLHRPATKDRGDPVGYYSVFHTTRDGIDYEYMSIEQVQDHRKQYVKYKSKAWDESFDEMAKKTVIRRLAKRCPASTEIQQAASLDEYGEQGLNQGIDYLVDGIPLPSRVGQMASKLAAKEDSRCLDEQILETLEQAGTDWDRFWKENGQKVLGNDSGIFMSLAELTDEDKQQVLELLS